VPQPPYISLLPVFNCCLILLHKSMKKGYMYILECADGSYYTGSTNNLALRLAQHQRGEGANHTRKRLPVTLVYYEEYERVDEAFYREKQVQGWSRKKKEALIRGAPHLLPALAMAYRDVRAAVIKTDEHTTD
jgi:putative endonuclease